MATTAELLQEARDAYHRVMTGGAVVEVRDSNGDSIRYSPANASRLLVYIKTLEASLAPSAVSVGPFRPIWG